MNSRFVRAMVLALPLVACSSPQATNPATCSASHGLKIAFSPMYTYWDGVHAFQVPAVVNGVEPTDVTWNASDLTKVSLAPDPNTGGIMITVANNAPGLTIAGPSTQVTMTAQANGQCGSSTLTITPAKESDDFHDGAVRYNDGIDLRPANVDAGSVDTMAACTNCHGASATHGPFKDIAHTPEQIGGFSDDDLDIIIRQGVVPAGGYFDSNIVSMDQWHQFHHWDMTDEELKGLLVYLRGLAPMPQQGSANFGGQWNGFGH